MNTTKRTATMAVAALGAVLMLAGPVFTGPALAEQKLTIGGTMYTKFLWGTERVDGSLYNFTTIPGEGYGDTGQGTEIELLLNARVSKWVEVSGRLKGRFNQNFWTNFGGFGGGGVGDPGSGDCIGGDCGENDPRSAQYLKVRGVTARITPGYSWLDSVTIGSSDFGMYDPFVLGKIRYIDRDNGQGLIFQGSNGDRSLTYDFSRMSLPRLWAGPNFQTGEFAAADAAYTLQLKYQGGSNFDIAGIYNWINDVEVDDLDFEDTDDGRDLRVRYRNTVAGVRLNLRPTSIISIGAQFYHAEIESAESFAPTSFGIAGGFSPVLAGKHDDNALKVDVEVNDPFSNGLSFNLQYFDIGAEYNSVLAARRESDVLLTEGHDGSWAFPGPDNSGFGVFGGNPTRIGYGGWQGNAQQVATISVDNEFTDFDEPMAETVIGWKGFTFNPTYGNGALDLSFEYTYIDYNTNWQAWGDASRGINDSEYPGFELDSGVGHNFRTAYVPFQEKETEILVLKGNYVIDTGKGVDLFWKFKQIDETDERLNEARFLPFQPGDCPGGGAGCSNNRNEYSTGNSTADYYGNPPVITVNGVTGYQWKPFDSISDDDRDLDYTMYQLGAGYQLSDELYASLTYEYWDISLKDGNTAFQAYNLHEMASGEHQKNKLILQARYVLGGAEIGFNYEYNFGDFDPDFGDGFVVQYADVGTAQAVNVPIGSPGFSGRFGNWNSLLARDFEQQRLKAYVKIQF